MLRVMLFYFIMHLMTRFTEEHMINPHTIISPLHYFIHICIQARVPSSIQRRKPPPFSFCYRVKDLPLQVATPALHHVICYTFVLWMPNLQINCKSVSIFFILFSTSKFSIYRTGTVHASSLCDCSDEEKHMQSHDLRPRAISMVLLWSFAY